MSDLVYAIANLIPLMLLGLVTVVHAEERFLPPKNTITTDVVSVAGRFAILKIDPIEEARARTIGIPLRNLGDTEIRLRAVRVNDECMTVLTDELVIAPNKTVSLYLSVTPLVLKQAYRELILADRGRRFCAQRSTASVAGGV